MYIDIFIIYRYKIQNIYYLDSKEKKIREWLKEEVV